MIHIGVTIFLSSTERRHTNKRVSGNPVPIPERVHTL